jgi:hypothetical protein
MDDIQRLELEERIEEQMDELEKKGELLKVEDLTEEVIERLMIQSQIISNGIIPIYSGDKLWGFQLLPDYDYKYEWLYEK